jgi:hypothetical protein
MPIVALSELERNDNYGRLKLGLNMDVPVVASRKALEYDCQ